MVNKKLINGLKYEKLSEEQLYDLSSWELVDIILAYRKDYKAKEQKLKKIEEFSHNYCMNGEDLLKPSHSCKGCNMVELKYLIEGKENG